LNNLVQQHEKRGDVVTYIDKESNDVEIQEKQSSRGMDSQKVLRQISKDDFTKRSSQQLANRTQKRSAQINTSHPLMMVPSAKLIQNYALALLTESA
jgi:hypothetical protein